MKIKNISLLTLFLLSVAPFYGKTQSLNYKADKTIALPGNGGYDYAYVDQINRVLYAAHGTTVNIVDLKTEKPVAVIGNMKGVHGIAVINELSRGFISDGKANTVVAFDTKTYKVIKTIPITGTDADAIIYDAFSKRIFVFEGDSHAFVVIDPKGLTQVSSIALAGAPEFAVSDEKGLIYNNLEDKNSLNVIDAKTLKIKKSYPLDPCGGPTGLAIDRKNQRLFTVCRENKGMSVIDIATGKVVQTVPIGTGVDAVIYDAVNKLVIASNGDGTTNIFKQNTPDNYSLVQTLVTQYRAKTMAMDNSTHKLYFPVANFQADKKTQIPDSFKLLVFRLN